MQVGIKKRICALVTLSVMIASVFVCSLALGVSEWSDGLFYKAIEKSSGMSDGHAGNTSLGALQLPGHRIVEDCQQETFLKGQHFNLKCMAMLIVILAIYSCLWFDSYLKVRIFRKVKFRLLI